MSEFDSTLEKVAKDLGISMTMTELPANSGYTFGLRVDGIDKPIGYEYHFRQGIMSWSIDLVLDNFSGELLRTFEIGFEDKRQEVLAHFHHASSHSSEIFLKVNEIDLQDRPSELWEKLDFHIKTKFELEDNPLRSFEVTLLYALSLFLPLFTEDEVDEALDARDWEVEGAISLKLSKKYERSRINRALCLAEHGYTCKACGILMEAKYGQVAKDFAEVHHIVPVSLMGAPRVVDPINELVPLCPNCHSVAHKRNPPFGIEAIIEMISEASKYT